MITWVDKANFLELEFVNSSRNCSLALPAREHGFLEGVRPVGKWISAGVLVLVGFSLLGGQYTLIGILMLAAAGLLVWLSVQGSGSRSYSAPARPAQLSSARYDAREEIASAERQAARTVRQAQEDAETEGQNALRAVMMHLANESRWV